MKNNQGQSLIEMAVFFLVLAPLIGLLLGFTRWFQIREKLLMGVWLGAELYSSGTISRAEVDSKVRAYLTTGTPALDPVGIELRMGPSSESWMIDQIDLVVLRYTPRKAWDPRLRLTPTLEEKCFIKHAPHYWDPLTAYLPIPGNPTISGPVYKWGE